MLSFLVNVFNKFVTILIFFFDDLAYIIILKDSWEGELDISDQVYH